MFCSYNDFKVFIVGYEECSNHSTNIIVQNFTSIIVSILDYSSVTNIMILRFLLNKTLYIMLFNTNISS